MHRQTFTGILTLLLLSLAVPFSHATPPQNNRYLRDGLSFSYPSEWQLTDESGQSAQSLNLDRGPNEAKIMIVALRAQTNSQEYAEKQTVVTEAIASALTDEIAKLGAQAERTSIGESIGGINALGIRLRASLKGEAGNADIYWLHLGGRMVHVVFVGSDEEQARAAYAWKMICSTLRIGSAPVQPPTQNAVPSRRREAGQEITRDLSQPQRDSIWRINK